MISPRLVNSTSLSFKKSVFGNKPICTKIPASSTTCSSSVARSLYLRPVTCEPSPNTSVLKAFIITVVFGKLCNLFCKTWSARSLVSNSTKVTCSTIPARSIAASTPELPPPITATRLPLNNGPSQCGQYATPRVRYFCSPGTFISLQRAPVERITVFDSSFAPFSSSTSTKPFAVWFAPVILLTRCRFMISTSYSRTWASISAANLGPCVFCTEVKFSMSMVSIT
ncbi:Uncharacterised protein [Acinetobacter pittii]|nr:Uncharacterised protein [Acinetobacter pittii]